MKRLIQAAVVIALCLLVVSPALAQPRRGSGGGSSGQRGGQSFGQRQGGPPRSGPDEGAPVLAIMRALDADNDDEISAEEIANAVVALKALDVDGDGKLTEADERGVNGARRPNRTGRRAQPPKVGQAQPPNIPAGEQGSNELAGRRGRHGPPEGVDGPPSPDQFVERAMEFDADQNGQLDARELKTFAQQMGPPQRSQRGPRHERGER